MKKRLHILFGAMLLLLMLSGCADKKVTEGTSAGVDEKTGSTLIEEPYTKVEWTNHKLIWNDKVESEVQSPLYLTGYHENWADISAREHTYMNPIYCGLDGDFCTLIHYVNDTGEEQIESWQELSYFNHATGESTTVDIQESMWGFQNNTTNFVSIDVAVKNRIALLNYQGNFTEDDYELTAINVLFYDMDKKADGIINLLPAVQEADISYEHETIYNCKIVVDGEENIYLAFSDCILVTDKNGKFLCVMHPAINGEILIGGKTPEHLPVFIIQDSNKGKKQFFCYDSEGQAMHILGETVNDFVRQYGIDDKGNMLGIAGSSLIRWNIVSGKREKIFDCEKEGICSNALTICLNFDTEGKLWILDCRNSDQAIYTLTREPPQINQSIKIINCTYSFNQAQSSAAIYSCKHPGDVFEYETHAGDEDYHNRFMADIVAGNGPDIMIVYADDFDVLQEKGVLADLSDVFDDEIKNQTFNYIWQAGTVDGKLYGIGESGTAGLTMVVSKDYWRKNSWTLTEMLSVMREHEDSVKGIIPIVYGKISSLYYILLSCIMTDFVDLEQGTCDFTKSDFRELLQYIHDAPDEEEQFQNDYTKMEDTRKNGEYLAVIEDACGFTAYDYVASQYGDDYHFVGLPSTDQGGHLFRRTAILAVKKDAENMEAIKDYLNSLYNKANQRKDDVCVRKDVLREFVVQPDWSAGYEFSMGEGMYTILHTKPDGTSYVDDYIELTDKLQPTTGIAEELAGIVTDETVDYFNDDKDLETTIDIIQNRIQLYLDEKKN